MGDEDREALAEAYARWAEAPFEPADWQRENGRQLADALLPVVDAIARRRAAEELRAAAREIEATGWPAARVLIRYRADGLDALSAPQTATGSPGDTRTPSAHESSPTVTTRPRNGNTATGDTP